jgi:hypothetical protein
VSGVCGAKVETGAKHATNERAHLIDHGLCERQRFAQYAKSRGRETFHFRNEEDDTVRRV